MSKNTANSLSPTIKTIVTIILLVLSLFIPLAGLIGIIVMWFWTLWPKWLKILITIPFVVFYTLLIISSISILSYLFLVRPFKVTSNGMAPNFNNGAYLIAKVLRPKNIIIKRGDVVIFKSPKNPEVEYIKRVVGMPGETVMIKFGEVYINGKKLDESKYLSSGVQTLAGPFLPENQSINIPNGQYFVLGDNRSYGSDSREWGFVPQENILAKVAFCYRNCRKK